MPQIGIPDATTRLQDAKLRDPCPIRAFEDGEQRSVQVRNTPRDASPETT